jgi:phosphate transport system substrate-binding protein
MTQSDAFKGSIGSGKQVKWPTGQGGKGSEGVAAAVQQTPGSIGYIESNYAMANKIAFGSVKNKSGKFVKATGQAVSAAGEGAVGEMKGQVLAANIWNQSGDAAYPISSFTYLIVYQDLNNVKTPAQAKALGEFLWWATHDGQRFTTEMDYAPLSKGVQTKVEEALRGVTYSGGPVISPGK